MLKYRIKVLLLCSIFGILLYMSFLYQDRDWLYQQYFKDERSLTSIASELGVDHTTVSKWRRKLNIPKPSKLISLSCPVCEKLFTRSRSQVDSVKTSVCSSECLYKGRTQGIIEHKVIKSYDIVVSQRRRISVVCKECGISFTVTPSRQRDGRGKYCSKVCLNKSLKLRMTGANNPQYIDGRSKNKRCYRGDDWDEVRKRIYKRDNYICQECGVKCRGRRGYNKGSDNLIQCHHIDPYIISEDNSDDNLVTVCCKCHSIVEKDPSYYNKTYFINKRCKQC